MLLNAVNEAREGGSVHKRKYFISVICLILLMLTVSGCFRITADELYSLPQASKEYLKLQELINTVLSSGAEYSPPTSGPNRQSVQMKDIDGDGSNEAIAFFTIAGDKPLKIYLMKQTGGVYRTVDVIEGDGAAIESIRYADMDGDGVSELIVGWQASAALLHMAIYSIKDYQHVQLASTDYSQIETSDMNNDGNSDVIVLRLPSSQFPAEAEMFSIMPDGEVSSNLAPLSKGIESIVNVMKAKLSDGIPALYVEGRYPGGNMVTDILAWRYNHMVNVTSNTTSGVSEETLRAFKIDSIDIDQNGVVDVPSPKLLVSSSNTQYYTTEWYAFDRFGNKNKIFTTYHDFSDEWYLILPDDWTDKITVRRDDTVPGERTLIFTYIAHSDVTGAQMQPVDFLKIYTLSGDNKEDRAKLEGRFEPLATYGDKIYAAEILTNEIGITVDKAMVCDNFRLIYSDWTNGVT